MSSQVGNRTGGAPVVPQQEEDLGLPRCLRVSQAGIATAGQFAQFMSGLISDLIEGRISPQVGNAAVNAGGKLLKVVEMQYRYGKPTVDGQIKSLDLIGTAVS